MRTIDVTIPAVVLDTGPDTACGLAALRVLGRLGVAVFGAAHNLAPRLTATAWLRMPTFAGGASHASGW